MTRSIAVRRLFGAALVGCLLLAGGPAPAETPSATGETFHYTWKLNNLLGLVAGLFIPRQGIGDLSFVPRKDGTLKSELFITSKESSEGAYWRYGAEIDGKTLQPLRAWSSYLWHGKTRSKNREIEQKGVLDIVSAIYAVRRDPPSTKVVLDIWTDGDVFPVEVSARGVERRSIGNRSMNARHFAFRPVELPGRLRWKGKIDVWYALDAISTPVEIDISRSLADLRLELDSSAAAAADGRLGPAARAEPPH